MELKCYPTIQVILQILLLIVPYGIEIRPWGGCWDGAPLLIVPYGIEIKLKDLIQAATGLLIVPYGIEITWVVSSETSPFFLLIVPYGIEMKYQHTVYCAM